MGIIAFGKIAKAVESGVSRRKAEGRLESQEERAENQESRAAGRFEEEQKRAPLERKKLEQGVESGERAAKREKFAFGEAEKTAEYTGGQRERTEKIQAIQDPIAELRAHQDDDYNTAQHKLRMLEQSAATAIQGAKSDEQKMAAMTAVEEARGAQYGLIWNAYKRGEGKAAAQMFNRLLSNGVQTAYDFVVVETEDGDIVQLVDVNGNPVMDPTNPEGGPVQFDPEEADRVWGYKGEKGTYKAVDPGSDVVNTATGAVTRGSGVRTKVDPVDNFLAKEKKATFGTILAGGEAKYAENQELYGQEAVVLARGYYNKTGDLNFSWLRAVREIRAKEFRDSFSGNIPGADPWGRNEVGGKSTLNHKALAQELTKHYAPTESGRTDEIDNYLKIRGVEDENDRADILMYFSAMNPQPGAQEQAPEEDPNQEQPQGQQAPAGHVNLTSPDGVPGFAPEAEVQSLLQQGYTQTP